MAQQLFDTPTLPRLLTLIQQVSEGAIAIPNFQRPFTWDDDRRLQLLDSIEQGMPIGSLLVWKTKTHKLGTYGNLGPFELPQLPDTDARHYLMDGHQRLTTLYAALNWTESPAELEDEGVSWPVYYDLQERERPRFKLLRRGAPPPLHWLPTSILFDGDRLWERTNALRSHNLYDEARKAERLANIFRDYVIPLVPLVSEDLNVVTDSFVRVNSQGKAMSEAEMLKALTFLSPVDTHTHFKHIRERLSELGWDIPDQWLVNALKVQLNLDVYGAGVRQIYAKLGEDQKPLEVLGDSLDRAIQALARLDVLGPKALPYAYQLVVLAALVARGHDLLSTPEQVEALRRWLWSSTFAEHFTGITGSRIRQTTQDLDGALRQGPLERLGFSLGDLTPIAKYRASTVRSKSFAWMLATHSSDEAIRRERLQVLAQQDAESVPRLFLKQDSEDPANRVIATAPEIAQLRETLRQGNADPERLHDTWAIPQDALAALPDETAFLRLRRDYLRALEAKRIAELSR